MTSRRISPSGGFGLVLLCWLFQVSRVAWKRTQQLHQTSRNTASLLCDGLLLKFYWEAPFLQKQYTKIWISCVRLLTTLEVGRPGNSHQGNLQAIWRIVEHWTLCILHDKWKRCCSVLIFSSATQSNRFNLIVWFFCLTCEKEEDPGGEKVSIWPVLFWEHSFGMAAVGSRGSLKGLLDGMLISQKKDIYAFSGGHLNERNLRKQPHKATRGSWESARTGRNLACSEDRQVDLESNRSSLVFLKTFR